MNTLRKLAVGIGAFILLTSLVGLSWSHVIASTTLKKDVVKDWIEESGFYNKVTDAVLAAASKNMQENGESGDIPVNDPQIQQIARESFSPEFLKTSLEDVLDGTYGWLEGKTDKPEFSVDINDAKEKLIAGLSNYAATRASTLPACTEANMPDTTDFNAFSATCLPPGITPQTAGDELRSQLQNSDEFFKDTQFTGDDLDIDQVSVNQNNEASFKASESERFQAAYKIASVMPYIFGALALASSLAVVFLSASRRSGVRRAGGIYITAGAMVGFAYLMFRGINGLLETRAKDIAGDSAAAQEIATDFVHAVYQDTSSLLLWYAMGFVLIGVAAFVFAHLYHREKPPTKESSDPSPPTDEPSKPSLGDTTEKTQPTASKKPPKKIQL